MNAPTQSRHLLAAAAATLADPRWSSVLMRDAAADGRFVFAIRSTGIYCRPSCAARRARPENVDFFADAPQAEAAGYRPCRRCCPDRPSSPLAQRAAAIAGLCRFIDEEIGRGASPSLAALAAQAGWSAHHLQRIFKSVTGLTPRQYAAARRAEALRDELLGRARSVTEAIHNAGYGSSSRFYERSDALLGMTAGHFRQRGARMRIRFAIGRCSLGAILVAQSERGVCAILLGDEPQALAHDLRERFANAELIAGDARFDELVARVVGLVEAPRLGLDLPLDLRGSLFQQRVWQALQRIPAGRTESYGEVAARLGMPGAARAVAAACAANPVAVAVPCHRVLRGDGALSGYRWGVERKRALLERERA